MAIFTRLIVLLAALLHISYVLAIPVPFGEVEKAWKEGRSERDIHAAELATPSFFQEARSDTAIQTKVTKYIEAFDSALDERSLAAKKVAKRGLSVVDTVQNFVDKKIVEWMRKGELRERDAAPVLRPRSGKRWNF